VEKNDSFLATELKDLKFLKKVSNPIVLGPWWFQCLAHFFTKNITVIDTANAIVPRVLKSGLNYLPFFFAPLLTVLGLIFRFLNIFLCAVGDIIDKFIYLLVVSWPLFLHGDLVNMNSLLPGLVIMLCSIVFLQKNVLLDPKTTTEIESKEYLVKNFAIGGYLMFFFFFYAVIILFPFICFIFGVEKICVIKLIYLTIQLIVLEKITFYQTSLFLSSLCAPFIFQFGLITSIIKNVF
jgi:hypothetical protein